MERALNPPRAAAGDAGPRRAGGSPPCELSRSEWQSATRIAPMQAIAPIVGVNRRHRVICASASRQRTRGSQASSRRASASEDVAKASRRPRPSIEHRLSRRGGRARAAAIGASVHTAFSSAAALPSAPGPCYVACNASDRTKHDRSTIEEASLGHSCAGHSYPGLRIQTLTPKTLARACGSVSYTHLTLPTIYSV